MKRSRVWYRLASLFIAAFALAAFGAGPSVARCAEGSESEPLQATGANTPGARQLLGAWRMASDDDKPGQKVEPEVITFNADGTYRVTDIQEPFGGRYRVDNNEVVMMLTVEGNTRVMRRLFKLDAQGLHFANKNEGFAHYVKIAK